MILIESLQIGRVRTDGDPDSRDPTTRQWTSAFRKSSVAGQVTLTPLGLAGDEVADTQNHGGPDKAILCYAQEHYARWKQVFPELSLDAGGLGENLTLSGIVESEVCLGDRFSADDCELEVSQPRQPCWKINRRWGVKTFTKQVTQTGRTGWYLRVIQAGTLGAGQTLTRTHRPYPQWTIARANELMFGREPNRDEIAELKQLDVLAASWKQGLRG